MNNEPETRFARSLEIIFAPLKDEPDFAHCPEPLEHGWVRVPLAGCDAMESVSFEYRVTGWDKVLIRNADGGKNGPWDARGEIPPTTEKEYTWADVFARCLSYVVVLLP